MGVPGPPASLPLCYTSAAMAQPAYRRKEYLVDRGYQLQFATRLFAVVFAVAVISALICATLLWKYTRAHGRPSDIIFITSLVAIAATLLIELLLAIPLIFFLGVRQSHRLIGPMKRLKATLEAIGKGDFSQRITLRPGDALEDLGRAINRMAQHLERRFPKSS